MSKLARKTDNTFGVCSHPDHDPPISVSGTITTGYAKVQVEGLDLARVGDTVTASCGHTGIIQDGHSKFSANGVAAAQLGSTFIGDYTGTITSAASKTG